MKSYELLENSNLNKSLMKSFEVLELIVKNEKMSIKEINDITNLGKSTIHRILSTFKVMNYVDQYEEDNKYFATVKLFELGNYISSRMPIKKIAKPYLQSLYTECNETINLGIITGDDVMYLDKIVTKEPLRIDLDIGKRVPIYCSSLGKAILAHSERGDLNRLTYKAYTSKTIICKEQLERALDSVCKNGYAFDDEEYIEHLSCLAVPIKDNYGVAIASISIATPTIRLSEEKKYIFIEKLKFYAQLIENEINKCYTF